MFILRKIDKQGLESNVCLGSSYNYVQRSTHLEEFKRCYKAAYHIETDDLDKGFEKFKKTCYGIVVYNNGCDLFPLYEGQQNYIMTESGKTFSNLTFK